MMLPAKELAAARGVRTQCRNPAVRCWVSASRCRRSVQSALGAHHSHYNSNSSSSSSSTTTRTRNYSRWLRRRVAATAEEEVSTQASDKPATVTGSASEEGENWIPVIKPEDLPKGLRKEVEVDGVQVLLFWYRNEIFAIEATSPAEGAYSEGFIKAKFTQDYCIECPGTQSLFSLKDGSIVTWYPTNPVLRALTPVSTCRPLQVYRVKLTQDAICVDLSEGKVSRGVTAQDRGGAGSSIEGNNVFTVQPNVYFEGQDNKKESASIYAELPAGAPNPAILLTGILAVGFLGASGTAICLYYENIIALIIFWIVLGSIIVFSGYNFINQNTKQK